jgi:hypothetical protein
MNKPHLKPKGKRGLAAVKRLGRDYKTGGFNTIAKKAAARYGSAEAGKRVAGAIYWNKVHHG